MEGIEAAASARGLRVHTVPLEDQFRCGGNAAYEQWELQLLGLDDAAPQVWKGDERFDVIVASSPMEMEAILRQKNDEGLSARMAAGFCWPWSDPREDGSPSPRREN